MRGACRRRKRGLFPVIQTTATLGLFAALLVVIGVRTWLGEEAFADWGWRIPFLISILLLAVSLWIRMKLEESPVFRDMKAAGEGSKAPLTEAFARWGNARIVIIALVGAVAGQAVVWYTGQFYALFFLEKTLKVDGATANILIAIALAAATPFFIFFGWLSDKIGRKPIIMAGCALAALTYFPLFGALTQAANPALARAQASAPVTVHADPADCRFSSIDRQEQVRARSCDVAKAYLAKASVSYDNVAAPAGTVASIRIGDDVIAGVDAGRLSGEARKAAIADFQARTQAALGAVGYPAKADPAAIDKPLVVAILFLLALYVTMVYGPIAACWSSCSRRGSATLDEPAVSLGNGWFGGFLRPPPSRGRRDGNIYYGLWYQSSSRGTWSRDYCSCPKPSGGAGRLKPRMMIFPVLHRAFCDLLPQGCFVIRGLGIGRPPGDFSDFTTVSDDQGSIARTMIHPPEPPFRLGSGSPQGQRFCSRRSAASCIWRRSPPTVPRSRSTSARCGMRPRRGCLALMQPRCGSGWSARRCS